MSTTSTRTTRPGPNTWETTRGRITYFVQVQGDQVVVGERHGGGSMDEDATAVSTEAFLGGRLQDVVRSDLGQAVLDEVLDRLRQAD